MNEPETRAELIDPALKEADWFAARLGSTALTLDCLRISTIRNSASRCSALNVDTAARIHIAI